MRHPAIIAVALVFLPEAAARGQSTADFVGRLQQQATAARFGRLDEKSSRLLLELETELSNDRYPSPRVLAALAEQLTQTGSRLATLAPDLKLLAAHLLKLTETPLAETCQSLGAVRGNWSAADLGEERRRLREVIDRCRFRLDTMPTATRAAWEKYLFWNETRGLAEDASFDEPLLERLEARWTNFHLAWNDSDFSRTALAVRRFIRQVRRAGNPPTPEAIAGRLAKIAELAAEDGPLSEEAHEGLSAELGELESRGIAADLTTAIRARASYPNAVVKISNELLVQRLAQPVAETFRIDQVFAGTRAVGAGRLSGTLRWNPDLNPVAAGWTWNLQANSNSRTTGFNSGVRVDSTSTTTVNGSKRFVLDATGLSMLPASAEVQTSVQYTSIAAGGGRRQDAAYSGAYGARPQAEAESEASARRSMIARLDGEAATLVTDFQRHYDRSIRSTLGRSTELASTIRAFGYDSGQTWACWLEDLHGLAAPVPAPERPQESELATGWHASFLQRYAAEKLTGRRFTTSSLAQELEGWLGSRSAAVTGEAAAGEGQLEFALDRPVICRISNGQLRLHLRLAEFTDGQNSFPAVSVYLSYEPRQTEKGWVLARISAAEAYPLDYAPGTGKGLSGRQLVLRQAVRRSLEAALRQELEISPLEIKWNSAVAPRHLVPNHIWAAAGWLSVDWQSSVATGAVATGP